MATDAKAAAWATEPIELGRPGDRSTPRVLGPNDVPAVTDEAEEKRAPEGAVLSAMAHGNEPDGSDHVQSAPASAPTLAGGDPEHVMVVDS